MQRLNEVVNAAKEACSELESCEVSDEPVLDSDQRPKTGSVIRQWVDNWDCVSWMLRQRELRTETMVIVMVNTIHNTVQYSFNGINDKYALFKGNDMRVCQ